MEIIEDEMKKMNVLEIIEEIIDLTASEGLDTEVKKGKVEVVSAAQPQILHIEAVGLIVRHPLLLKHISESGASAL